MTYPLFLVDAFTDQLFGGNPAAVMPLPDWLPDATLRRLAAENAQPETAFFRARPDGAYDLRWFTPDIEMDLCGHATLATAHVLTRHLGCSGATPLVFHTRSGELRVRVVGEWYELDLPSRPPRPATLPEGLAEAFEYPIREVWQARDYVLVFDSAEQIRQLQPNRTILDRFNLDPGGIICTAVGAGTDVDFVSRFFTPQSTIFEDPVTGSAHCTLVPFWAERLGRTALTARQVSARGGYLRCKLHTDRVLLAGQAVTYLEGQVRGDLG